MSLKCPDSQELYIRRITMGRSYCFGHPKCCPNLTHCTVEAPTKHLDYVRRSCDGKGMCAINLKNLWCGSVKLKKITDYESVHYSCNNTGELTLYRAALHQVLCN